MNQQGAKTSPVPEASGKSGSNGLLIGAAIVCTVLILWTLIIGFMLLRKYTIPSASNVPTLLVGDYVLALPGVNVVPGLPWVGRMLSGPPERGELSIFIKPDGSRADYIKRVVGMPGDTVQMQNGTLLINGSPVPKRPLADYTYANLGETMTHRRFEETLPGGVSHETLDAEDDALLDNTEVFTVPPGHYFVLGDNRDNSSDSRDPESGVGFVPAENFEGKAVLVYFSWSGSWPRWVR